MITPRMLYEATGDGLDILLYYFPQAREVAGTKNKFKARESEDDASAMLRKGKNGVWKFIDFGDDAREHDPIEVCMEVDGLRFSEAIIKLAGIFNVTDELDKSVNCPEFSERAANQDELEGKRYYELSQDFTAEHLAVMGPRVKAEHMKALHWYLAKWVSLPVKNRVLKKKHSTDTYPIFMRECLVEKGKDGKPDVIFYKIYEPLNPKKEFRFSYTPPGVKPKDYINGLSELRQRWTDYNASERKLWESDPANEDKPYREKKLPEAFICSGERDAICVRSLGYFPIWFNSETYKLSDDEYREIMKYVEVLYNIPDIDATGRAKGTELALRFLDVHTVWLPEWIGQYRDRRGKPRKDFRDWIELRHEYKDFKNLTAVALPAKFWTEKVNGKTGAKEYTVDSVCLLYFLRLNGFHKLHDRMAGTSQYVRIVGNVVTEVKTSEIRDFIHQWAEENFLPRELRNVLMTTTRLSDLVLDNMGKVELDFTNYTAKSQIFFFEGSSMEVTGSGIREHRGTSTDLNHYVWSKNVLPHRVKLLPPLFSITREETLNGPRFDIKVESRGSKVFDYIINSSRIYWREELEKGLENLSDDEAAEYRREHKFDIEGPNLDAEQIAEQKQNLINKIFSIGYTLHRFKSPSRAWAPYAMDNKIDDEGECNGRSGKSLIFALIKTFLNSVKLSGRNPKLMDNNHWNEQVTRHTDLLFIDDCDRYLNIGLFYDLITSEMTVNPKYSQSYNIPFQESPKLAFSTNYVPYNFDPSTDARLLYMVFGDYYHIQTETNDYLESRGVRDDFGKDLFGQDYTDEEWNQDINFFLQCTQFYLSLASESIKLLPPMGNIVKRKWKADMGANFEDWANFYFSETSGNINKEIVREDAFLAYKMFAGVNKITMQKFTKSLKAFVALCPYVEDLNPLEMCNAKGRRIVRKVEGIAKDMIYLRGVGAEVKQEDEPPLWEDLKPKSAPEARERPLWEEDDDDGPAPY